MAISGITLSGSDLTSGNGIDVASTVSQLMAVARKPEDQLKARQSTIQTQETELQTLISGLSTLVSDVNSLKDITGALSQLTASSSDSTAVEATIDSTASAGVHTVVVNNLAETSTAYSNALDSAASAIGDGDLSFTIGSGASQTTKTITFASGTTVNAAVNQINQGSYGVTASVITDATGSRLALTSSTDGAGGTVAITGAPANLSFTTNAGKDASATVDGVPITSASNSVTGAIAGVTLLLTAGTNGAEVRISVGNDAAQASQAVQAFVSDYNAIMVELNKQFKYDQSTGTSGTLSGDSAVRSLQEQLLHVMGFSTTNNESYQSLGQLGISMNNDGTLTLNTTKLNNALTNNYSDFKSFFQTPANSGFAQHVSTVLNALNNSITGPLQLDYKSLQSTYTDLQSQIDDMEVNFSAQEITLTAKYNQINVMLESLPNTLSQIDAVLGWKDSKNND